MTTEPILSAHARPEPVYPPGDHRAKHPLLDDQTCYACHLRSISLGKGDLSPEVADINRRERNLGKDREAYRRLRRDGLQPPQVRGSDALEARAMDQVEMDFKISIPKKDLAQVKEIQAQVAMEQWGGNVNG